MNIELWQAIALIIVWVSVGGFLGYAITKKPAPSKGRPND